MAVIDTEKVGTGPLATAYFGAVMTDADDKGGAKLGGLTADGPAAKAGLMEGDVVTKAGDAKVTNADDLQGAYSGKKPGDKLSVTALRDGKEVTVEVTLSAPPVDPATLPVPTVGFTQGRGDGVVVGTLTANGPAAKAGLKEGDAITAVDGKKVGNIAEHRAALGGKKEGDKVKLTAKRGDAEKEYEVTLGPPAGGGNDPARGGTAQRPLAMGLGGQQANRQGRQGKDGYQTGGVFVSKDNGDTWTRVNSLNPRPMYFSQIRIDPTDDGRIYLLGDVPTPIFVSTDGGKTFGNLATAAGVHADAHALWIDPRDGRRMIVGCDGGFYGTYDRGAKWEHHNAHALGQFYHVAVDTRKPYRVYGGLQDNGSWGGPSDTLKRDERGREVGPVNEDWVFVRGGDGFVCRVDPTDPDQVYAESQNGAVGRRNYRTGESAGIGAPPVKEGESLRFNWNTPFILSGHNPGILYVGAQYVFRSVKKGTDPKAVSPDLTRTRRGSLTALGESPRTPDVLWAGTDDGHLWVTKDGGTKWENVTDSVRKAGLPGFRHVASVEPSREKAGRCYVAFDAHRSDDDKPYLFLTEDHGATWKAITANMPEFGSTRVLREDIANPNLLYCGTEFGAFVSLNRGGSWTRLGGGLPTVACHEFAQPTTAGELVVGTHGRSVWVLDVSALRQMTPAALQAPVTLFAPATAVRWRYAPNGSSPYSETDRKFVGENPSRGATFDVLVTPKAKKAALKVQDATGKTVWEYGDKKKPLTEPGLHRVRWNLSGGGGPVKAGGYRVLLTVDDKEYVQPLAVELDPNLPKDAVSVEGWVEDEGDDEEEKPVAK